MDSFIAWEITKHQLKIERLESLKQSGWSPPKYNRLSLLWWWVKGEIIVSPFPLTITP